MRPLYVAALVYQLFSVLLFCFGSRDPHWIVSQSIFMSLIAACLIEMAATGLGITLLRPFRDVDAMVWHIVRVTFTETMLVLLVAGVMFLVARETPVAVAILRNSGAIALHYAVSMATVVVVSLLHKGRIQSGPVHCSHDHWGIFSTLGVYKPQ